MAFTHRITKSWSDGSRSIVKSKEYSGDARESRELSIPDSTTDQEVVMSLDVSAVKGCYIVCDQAVTIETNDGTTPDQTLILKAGVPYEWDTDSYDTFKFTDDITALYVTNASGATASLQIEKLR